MNRTARSILPLITLALLACEPPEQASLVDVEGPFGARLPIIDGAVATPDQIAGTVYVSLPESTCTGTLIAPRVVVTAAHCLTGAPGQLVDVANTYVVAGAIDVDQSDASQWYAVTGAAAHPSYTYLQSGFGTDPTGLGDVYDIGVLVLENPVTSLPSIPVMPADLFDSAVPAGTSVVISGYGRTSTTTTDGGVLYIASTPYQRRSETEILLGAAGNPDTCQGDSGGPAYAVYNEDVYLIGATSRSSSNVTEACGEGGPSTLVSEFTGWLTTATGGLYQGPEASGCGGECGAVQTTACTCGATDPCGWQHDGFCDADACAPLTSTPFDDSADCGGGGGGGGGGATCGGECDAPQYTPCTCGSSDPCGWRSDGYCDDACADVTGTPFDDSADCGGGGGGGGGGEAVCGGACDALSYDACTCGSTDPCGWREDGYCDSDCAQVVGAPFDDSVDCGGGGGGDGAGEGNDDDDDDDRIGRANEDRDPPPPRGCRCVEGGALTGGAGAVALLFGLLAFSGRGRKRRAAR